jgi:hypothetical protein
MEIRGSVEFLYNYSYPTRVIGDTFIPDGYIWIMAPLLTFIPENGLYEECIQILSSPKNYQMAKELSEQHNVIYNTPLMKVLNEET